MSTVPLHVILHHAINFSGRAAIDIAADLGYPNPNIISAFRSGSCRVPLHKLPALSASVGLDPSETLRKALEEYNPQLLHVIEEYLL